MKRTDVTVLAAIGAIALIAAFWLLVLSPKRDRAGELETQVNELRSAVEEQEQLAAYAAEARDRFGTNYRQLVVLGKAVPEDADTPSLLVQLQRLADRADVDFRSIELDGNSAPAPPPPPTVTETQADSAESSSSEGTTEPSATVPGSEGDASSPAPSTATASSAAPVPATEAAAAILPIGASVGPAGLPTMPYSLKFNGGFFEVADFLANLDSLVPHRHGDVTVQGRLLTVDGFTLSAHPQKGFPALTASLAVTTYLTPATQGLTAGATPSGPAPASPPTAPTPTAATTVQP